MRWFVRYGVWVVLAVVVLVWELVAVKSLRAALRLGPRNHPTLSELVWMFERRYGAKGRVVVALVLADLAAHFLAGTSLVPFVG